MIISTDTTTDELLLQIDNWKIYATQGRKHFYLVSEEHIILILPPIHNETMAVILETGIRRIVYLVDKNTESLGFSLHSGEKFILTNSALEATLASALGKLKGGIVIMTPSAIHQSGYAPFDVTEHPSGKSFEVIATADLLDGTC